MATEIITKTLGAAFARAAPENLTWMQEREFFQVQVRRTTDSNKSIEAAVINGNERTIESLRQAARQCAAMGLSMNPIAALVYFIPRRERTFNEEIDKSQAEYQQNVPWIITATPSYRGLAWIITHYAGASDVAASEVYAGDDFQLRGPMERPKHLPTADNKLRSYAHAIGVYALAVWPGSRCRCEYVDAPTIERIRAMSDRPGALMWNPAKFWTEGWKKAAVRRLAKLAIQGNTRFDAAEEAMQAADGITIDQGADDVPRGTPPGAPASGAKARGMDGLRSKLDQAAGAATAATEAQATVDAAIKPTLETKLEPPWWVESKQPPETIEWWADQIAAAADGERLDRVKVEALAKKVDQGVDADAFRKLFRERKVTLRGASQQPTK